MYEITTIGGIGQMGAFPPPLDIEKFKQPEVVAAAVAGLVIGVVLGALIKGGKKR